MNSAKKNAVHIFSITNKHYYENDFFETDESDIILERGVIVWHGMVACLGIVMGTWLGSSLIIVRGGEKVII